MLTLDSVPQLDPSVSPWSYFKDSDSHWTDKVLPMRSSDLPVLFLGSWGERRIPFQSEVGATNVASSFTTYLWEQQAEWFLFRPFLETQAFPGVAGVSSCPSPPSCLRLDHTYWTKRPQSTGLCCVSHLASLNLTGIHGEVIRQLLVFITV